MQQILQVFPDMHVNTPYPIHFGCDWITVITTVTGTITGQMTLLDGTVTPRQASRSTSSPARRA
jgi:hypothetical protein